jgi:arginyl-tRNA synthetase
MSFKKFIGEANEVIKFALEKLDIRNESYSITEPAKEDFGDLSCNVAFLLTKELQKSPYEIASMLVEQYPNYSEGNQLESGSYISSVIAHESGYINFKANFNLIGKEIISDILENDLSYLDIGKQRKVIVEHTSVNPNKALHVGHLRNVVI